MQFSSLIIIFFLVFENCVHFLSKIIVKFLVESIIIIILIITYLLMKDLIILVVLDLGFETLFL